MSNIPPEMQALISGVVEHFNKTLAPKLEALDQRVKALELEMQALRQQTIEGLVRSLLAVKTEDLAAEMSLKMTSSLGDYTRSINALAGKIEAMLKSMEETVKELKELEGIPSKVMESLSKVKVEAKTNIRDIEAIITKHTAKSIETSQKVETWLSTIGETLSKMMDKINQLATALSAVVGGLNNLQGEFKKFLDDLPEKIRYEVKRAIQELEKSSGEEE